LSIIISSTNDKREYKNKPLINIGTNPKCDFFLNLKYDLIFTVQYNREKNIFQVINNYKNQNILYKDEVLQRVIIEKGICRITFKDTNEFIEISASKDDGQVVLSEDDLRSLYGDDTHAEIKAKIEKAREPIEKARVSILKQISYSMSELKSKLKTNSRTSIILHIGLYSSSLLSSFALANYLMGLTIQESSRNLYLSTNIQSWVIFSFIVFGIGLMLKRGVNLHYMEKIISNNNAANKSAKWSMIFISTVFIIGIYAINLIYFSSMTEFFSFAFFITIFFTGALTAFAIACGYFQTCNATYSAMLNKYEFREDFESVIKAYRIWIERYVNCLSSEKINKVKDVLLSKQIASAGETVLGLLTAPFLAYGVSNTLAMCFPEAANWVRVSGLRFSPIFLILATALIVAAFFAFVNAFVANKKIQASQVIKMDGFSDYTHHGVSIYGLEGVRKLESEKKMFMTVGCIIVFIEFMMNVSYFITEMGSEIQGVLLSFVAALVPTALLIAETLILAVTKFDIHNYEELILKLDKE